MQVGARGGKEIPVALAECDEKIAELECQIADAAKAAVAAEVTVVPFERAASKADELLVAVQSHSLRCQKSWHGPTQRVIIHAFKLFAGRCLYDFVNHRDTPE